VIAEIAGAIPPAVATFLLTSRREPEAVVDHVRASLVTVVQLVNAVPHATYKALRKACPSVRIVQVIHIEDDGAFTEASRVTSEVDALLLDSGRPTAPVQQLGGTGRTHDWSVSRRIVREFPIPVFLAGGLRATNVSEAIARVLPYGVDVCSGVRTDGALDDSKLCEFLEEVRRADACSRSRAT
jgi:phosphoribosylanthranilate isomerase